MAQNGFLQAISSFGENVFPGIQRLWNKWTGKSLTPAEQEANAFSASEAQKQRDWEMQMSNTSYQRSVKDMQAAGVNPAMAMSQGGASTPSGTAASSVSPSGSDMSFSDIMQLVMLPLQKKLLKSQIKLQSEQGEAALLQGRAAMRNATTNEGGNILRGKEVGISQYRADTERIRAHIEAYLAESNVRVNDKRIDEMAANIAYIDESREYISKNYEVALKNANSSAKQAAAALRSADAAFQNALTNEYLSNYQTDVYFSQAFLNELLSTEKRIDISFLPEKNRAQVEELRARGYLFNQKGQLVDKEGKLLDAQAAETYTRMATEITHAACEAVNTAVGFIPGKSAPIGFK